MLLAFPFNGGSVNARRYAHHEESSSHCAVRPGRDGGISGPGCLSLLLWVADVSRRSAVSHYSSTEIALNTSRRAA
jgi:hypothetical protein